MDRLDIGKAGMAGRDAGRLVMVRIAKARIRRGPVEKRGEQSPRFLLCNNKMEV